MDIEFKVEGFEKLLRKLNPERRDIAIRQSLSSASIKLAQWSAKNRIATLNPNRKQVLPDKLTARSATGYKYSIFGQHAEDIRKEGNVYIGKFGTNKKSKSGFSYPTLHEFGGSRHRPRPVLMPAIKDSKNKKMILDLFAERIEEQLRKE